MAYFSKEMKKEKEEKLKKVMPRGWKFTTRVYDNMKFVVTIRSAPVDLIGIIVDSMKYNNSNVDYILKYGCKEHIHPHPNYIKDIFKADKKILKIMLDIIEVIDEDNYDNSDSQTDYFDVGYYSYLCIGERNKPFKYTGN